MGLLLELFGGCKCVDFKAFPPGLFIASLMQLPVMTPAERDNEFIAHLQVYC
jgi:hypothetical protein